MCRDCAVWLRNKKMAPYKAPFETDDKRNIARCATLIRPTRSLQSIGFERFVGRIRRLNCTPNVGHNLTSEGAVYETFI
ncbi:hypothetical protein BH100L_01431 [Escherichia coli]|nr:hypothetical protein BH100L_01431 [Escherichia coli]